MHRERELIDEMTRSGFLVGGVREVLAQTAERRVEARVRSAGLLHLGKR